MSHRASEDEHGAYDLIFFVELRVYHDVACVEALGGHECGDSDLFGLHAGNLATVERVPDFVLQDLMERVLRIVTEDMVILR